MPPVTAEGARRSTRRSDTLSSLLSVEWPLVCAHRLNVLFVGPKDATCTLLNALQRDFCEPVIEVSSREPLILPDAEHVGTLILDDIATLATADQQRLLIWLERAVGQAQVLSTSSAPVLPMVLAGAFGETLYYRLNTFYVDLTAESLT